ncbi:MAG: protein-export chaperone SecB [Candidatus Accumulibacter sp.]|jgi:preprotein translocase subunit SecB|nr:protein-export chaperone SecB [Accumulibacter sp.]
MTEQEAPAFAIEKLYVKDLSLEVPNTPSVYLEHEQPEINIQLQTGAVKVGDDTFEVTLTVTASSRLGEKNIFLVEVSQAGLFHARNIPEENLNPLLSIACPNILFPYARETVSDAVARAGFPPLVLQPVNFEAMYLARAQQEQEQRQKDNTAQA